MRIVVDGVVGVLVLDLPESVHGYILVYIAIISVLTFIKDAVGRLFVADSFETLNKFTGILWFDKAFRYYLLTSIDFYVIVKNHFISV